MLKIFERFFSILRCINKKSLGAFVSFCFLIIFGKNLAASAINNWMTDVAVFCDDDRESQTLDVLEKMCVMEYFTPTTEDIPKPGFPNYVRINKDRPHAILNLGNNSTQAFRLHVNFRVLTPSKFASGNAEIRKFMQGCSQAIIFYDIDRKCKVEELIEKIDFAIKFILSLDKKWNNCVNFANFCTNRKDKKLDGPLNESIKSYRAALEAGKIYGPVYEPLKNNRWDRTHSGAPEVLFLSILDAYNQGIKEGQIFVKRVECDCCHAPSISSSSAPKLEEFFSKHQETVPFEQQLEQQQNLTKWNKLNFICPSCKKIFPAYSWMYKSELKCYYCSKHLKPVKP